MISRKAGKQGINQEHRNFRVNMECLNAVASIYEHPNRTGYRFTQTALPCPSMSRRSGIRISFRKCHAMQDTGRLFSSLGKDVYLLLECIREFILNLRLW